MKQSMQSFPATLMPCINFLLFLYKQNIFMILVILILLIFSVWIRFITLEVLQLYESYGGIYQSTCVLGMITEKTKCVYRVCQIQQICSKECLLLRHKKWVMTRSSSNLNKHVWSQASEFVFRGIKKTHATPG